MNKVNVKTVLTSGGVLAVGAALFFTVHSTGAETITVNPRGSDKNFYEVVVETPFEGVSSQKYSLGQINNDIRTHQLSIMQEQAVIDSLIIIRDKIIPAVEAKFAEVNTPVPVEPSSPDEPITP